MILSDNIIFYTLISLLVLFIIAIILIIRLSLIVKRLNRNTPGISLVEAMTSFEKDIAELNQFQDQTEQYLIGVERRLRKSIRGVHNLHFKAFGGLESGGQQSFAVALLDEQGDGFILSSLHARDRVNVFSKSVTAFECDLQLGAEEKVALEHAIQSIKQ